MNRVYAREEFCIACGLCQVHCLVEHSWSKDIIKAFKRESPRPVARVRLEQNGPLSFAVQCRHCAEPVCVYSCLTGALSRDSQSGVVTVDEQKCIGCWTCIMVCPYGAITRDSTGGNIVKCDLCPHRDLPACVANCPNEALVLVAEDHLAVEEAVC